MFVGDVRCATTGAGSSWKLSGGSQLSSAPTNVSKKRHVRRAITRANAVSSSLNRFRSAGRGLLAQYATSGERSQTTESVPITGSAAGLKLKVKPIAIRVSIKVGNRNQTNDCTSFRTDFSASAADTHSSNFFREISWR